MTSTTYPDWVPRITDADLTLHFGAPTVARGTHYANLGRVAEVQSSGTLATAQVRGSNFRQYQTSVNLKQGVLTATCSCPMRSDCKHAVALILSMRTPGKGRRDVSWQALLQPLMDKPQVSSGAPMALIVTEDGPELGIVPARMGTRGNWVRTGVAWRDLVRDGGQLHPGHLGALRAVMETRNVSRMNGYPHNALAFNELSPTAWDALRRAQAAGVEFLPGTAASGHPLAPPVISPHSFEPTLLVERSDGALRLTPAVTDGDGVTEVGGRALLGRPAHGVSLTRDGQLFIGPLARPLSAEEQRLFAHGPVTVPESDEATFAAGFLPQLRRRLPVRVARGVDLAEPQAPRLLLRAEFGTEQATLAWGFRYRVGRSVIDVPLQARSSEPHPRDYGAEAALLPLATGTWLPRPDTARPELTTLTGRSLIGFVTDDLPRLEEHPDVEVEASGERPSFQEADEAPSIELTVTESERDDWFDLGVDVTVGGKPVPLADLLAALTAGKDHLVLDSGVWFPLDAPELNQLRELLDEARLLIDHDGEGTIRLRPEHVGLWDELVSLGVVAEQSAAWQRSVRGLQDPESLPTVELPTGLDATLRPYQETGFRWLTFLWQTGLGGILADEMGLGKTLQSLAFLQAAHERGELTAPALVVAPTSVIGTWAAEAERFAPGLEVAAITETHKRRGTPLEEAVDGAHLVVTSYTLLRLEEEGYRGLDWSAVFLDEAQFVKNHASKAYKAVRRLRARMKLALTGTPLENNLLDLWSLLSITAPGLFPDPKAFTTAFRKPIESGNKEALARLHRRTRPLILRRTKAAVAEELPDKQEQVVPVQLEPGHRRLYDKHLARERQKVLGLVGDLNANRITILRSLTMLRQLSLSPVLVDGDYPAASAKIDALLDLLDEALAEGHRALVFSQFTGFLGLVRQRLDMEQISYEYLDGATRNRAERISSFREGDASLFLISLKAGGFGLTLTEADYVFILDPWWNPAAESQAIDRTHRIGQDKPVNVYRLVAANTIEEKVVALQERKRALFDDVVGAGSDTSAPMTAADIMGLLEG